MIEIPFDDLDPEAKALAQSLMVVQQLLEEPECEYIISATTLGLVITMGVLHASACYKLMCGHALPWDTKSTPEQVQRAIKDFGIRPYKEQWS